MKNRTIYFGITIIIIAASTEIISLSAFFLLGDFYDQRDVVLERLNEKDLETFAREFSDPVFGWDYHGPKVAHDTTCLGSDVTYSFDAMGARLYSGYHPDDWHSTRRSYDTRHAAGRFASGAKRTGYRPRKAAEDFFQVFPYRNLIIFFSKLN